MLLLTAFNPFGQWTYNTSKRVLHRYMAGLSPAERSQLRTEVLDTEYEAADRRVRRLISEFRPAGVLMLGMAGDREVISLERFALNIDDAETPDNSGVVRRNQLIDPDGPNAYRSAWPLTDMSGALKVHDIPVEISNHAGAFLCNHVFYQASRHIQELGLDCPVGFIHLPRLSEESEVGLPTRIQVQALGRCVQVATQALNPKAMETV